MPGGEHPTDGGSVAAFSQHEEGATVVIVAVGEIDVSTSPQLQHDLDDLIEQGARSLVVDLERVEFIDSAGLGVLVGVLRRLRQEGGELTVRNLGPATRRVFEITGLDQILAG